MTKSKDVRKENKSQVGEDKIGKDTWEREINSLPCIAICVDLKKTSGIEGHVENNTQPLSAW